MAIIDFEDPFAGPALRSIEAEALLALGRLDGALAMCTPTTLRLFATRLLREFLVAALRQEGYAFTDQRFHAWFAGVTTLSDQPAHTSRPPRVLCAAILTELTHSSWEVLAELAARFQTVLLAPHDHPGCVLADETPHQDTHTLIAAARDLIVELAPSPHPLDAVARLHSAAGEHILFAPSEPAPEPIAIGSIRLTVERAAPPCPRWALEMLWGEHWHRAGLLPHALPFPGLLRLDAMITRRPEANEGPDGVPIILATALRDVAQGVSTSLSEADRLARWLADCQPGRRRSSRAPALLELLAGFGPLRSAQLEALLGVTRLGLRTMLNALDTIGLLKRSTLAGVHLYAVTLEANLTSGSVRHVATSRFSRETLGAFDAAMADIDMLLARRGVIPAAIEEANEP